MNKNNTTRKKEYNTCIIGGGKYNGQRSIRTSMFQFYFLVFINIATDWGIIHRLMGGGAINCELGRKCRKQRS